MMEKASDGWWHWLPQSTASLVRWLLGEPPVAMPLPSEGPTTSEPPVRAPASRSVVETIAPADERDPDATQESSQAARRFAVAAGAQSPRARVIAAFDAAQPVDDRYELLGRMAELNRLVDGVVERHQHAVIFGARGSGKTSLARTFGDLADEADCLALYHAATGDSGFVELLRPYLPFLVAEARPAGRAEISALADRDFTARELVSAVVPALSRRVFLIVDEFDRIAAAETKAQLASLLKLLSDTRAPLQILLAGIAADVEALIDAHLSLRRHLIAVPVRPFDSRAVEAVIDEGTRRCGIAFPAETRAAIAAVAAGSPYHVRLFCQAAALAALETGRDAVDAATVRAGLQASLDDWATVNAPVALLFDRLAEHPELHPRLRSLACDAATHQQVAVDAVPHTLAPALTIGGDGLACFADTLAPQFLLARLHLAGDALAPDLSTTSPPSRRFA
ncbi:ATP-binding protein [Sphingomonas sp. ac-8]|uniref:ATP-binding protein n=1 Tax=Sphingomonas sp. ac-8 TaxID=3242977 RepID=UPI003A810424